MNAVSTYKSDLEDRIKEGGLKDQKYQFLKNQISENKAEKDETNFRLNENGLLTYKNRLYIPNVPEIKLLILNEIHKSPYFGHLGYQKMITMLRKDFFWPNMKSEVA